MDMVKNASILTIGNEIVSGITPDTNSAFIATHLKRVGIAVKAILSVGDDPAQITSALNILTDRSDIVIVSGGLGPTHDDVTRTAALEYFRSKLVYRQDIKGHIESLYRKRGRTEFKIPENQLYFPDNAEIIYNPQGSAQGMKYCAQDTIYYFLPGVPVEMERMLTEKVIPDLAEITTGEIHTRLIHTTGCPESEIYRRLRSWIGEHSEFGVSILPRFPEVDITVTAPVDGDSEMLGEALSEVVRLLGNIIFGYDNETLEVVIANHLIQRGLTLSVAESCTGGLIANRLTNVPGSSAYFIMGAVCYHNRIKSDLLGVPPEVIATHGAVSSQTAISMAAGIRRYAGTDMGLSTTGIAGPAGGTSEKPVGTVYVGIATSNRPGKVFKFVNNIDRERNKFYFSQMALNQLRLRLEEDFR